ncbi:MAG: DUF2764 family protein [Sphingobacteriales bacterium]|nr:MAG: DUF2764 family protein [Sphingobacteriales bacterium]
MNSEARTYHGIVSSLPNISLDGNTPTDEQNLATRYADFIHPTDLWLLQLAYMPADHANLLNKLYSRKLPFNQNANFSPQQLETIIAGKWLPYPYLNDFFTHWWQHHGKAETYADSEIELTHGFYRFLLNCGNVFLQKWSRYVLELNNFSLMQYKAHGLPNMRDQLVAQDEVAYLVGKYQAMSEQEALIPVTQTAEIWNTENPMEREKMLDTLKWQFIETEQFFYFFGIEKIIGYALQQQISHRWYRLNQLQNLPSSGLLLKNILSDLVAQLIQPIHQTQAKL